MITCEFNQGSKVNHDTGRTDHNVLCGKKASLVRCKGELTSLTMPLCDFHINFVVNRYKWQVNQVEPTTK